MIPINTLRAAARVAAFAARRQVFLVASLLPLPDPADLSSPTARHDAPGLDTDQAELREPHPQGGGTGAQRIISA